jgi:lipocalin
MSRTPAMDEATYNQILARLDACGYDIGKIEKTLQPSGPLPE